MMAGALLYNVKDAARLQKIRFALFKLGISGRTVAPEELSHPVGYLCGLEGFSAAEEPVAGSFSDEMLVLYGLTGAQLDALLSALRRSRVLIPLKAVVTEDNAAWSSIKLHDELFREHEAMKSVRAKDAKKSLAASQIILATAPCRRYYEQDLISTDADCQIVNGVRINRKTIRFGGRASSLIVMTLGIYKENIQVYSFAVSSI